MNELTRTEPATLEQIYELGRQAAQHMDTGRWTIGDLAVLIKTHYDDDDIGKFARQINVPTKRVYEYRKVASFYEISARAEFLEANPMITYTHFRTAMRRGEVEKAYQFLERASIRGWTSDRADYVMMRLLGRPDGPVKIIPPTPFRVVGADRINRRAMIQFEDDLTAERFAGLYRDNETGLELAVLQQPRPATPPVAFSADDPYSAPADFVRVARGEQAL